MLLLPALLLLMEFVAALNAQILAYTRSKQATPRLPRRCSKISTLDAPVKLSLWL
jgi:hypothetical protein